MILPTDQNYSFNIKVLSDLVDLCNQLQKLSSDEDYKLKESLISKSYINDDLLLSQSSIESNPPKDKLMSEKTSRLLSDYEKLKFESEHLKAENSKLKELQTRPSGNSSKPIILSQDSYQPMSHFDSLESLKGHQKN